MTADEIARALIGKPITPLRIEKAKHLAKRSKVEWETVLAAVLVVTDEAKAALEQVH